MLKIRNLTKAFAQARRSADGGPNRIVALDGIDLDVDEGVFATVLGPSGCGKTTLLRSIAGFEAPDSGSIEIAGRPMFAPTMRTVPAFARGVGIVPQDGALFPHLSVAQNVAFGLQQLDRRGRRRRTQEVLELVSLGNLGVRRPHELSGGQQQRVALARALAPRPRLILLDEPFSALDAHLRQSLRAEVRQLLHDLGTTSMLVTHDQAEAFAMADHLIVMRDGQIVSAGDPRDTYFRPDSVGLAKFLGEAVILPGQIDRSECTSTTAVVSCALGCLPVRTWHGEYGACEVLIRPENIHLENIDVSLPTGDGFPLQAQGVVVGQAFFGHDELLDVEVPGLVGGVPVRVTGENTHRRGEPVTLSVSNGVCTFGIGKASLT